MSTTTIGGANGGTKQPPFTSTERSRRSRQRQRDAVAAAAAGVAPTAAIVAPPLQRGVEISSLAALVAALALAFVSGGFAIVGLVHIFAGAFWPVIAMGCAFEAGKLSAVAWLGRRHAAPLPIKAAIISLVAALMTLNSLGCYGYLAHAHLEHAIAGEVELGAHDADVASWIRVQTGILADIDRRIAQVDAAVDSATKRGRVTAAMALAAEQTKRRGELATERVTAATKLGALQVEAAGIAGERQRLTADLGPIKYLAALLHVDDTALMRLFILVVAVLLDPLAVVLLLAAACRVPPARAG